MTEKKAEPKKENLRYQRDRDRQKVQGVFRFHEVPGGRMEFVYKKYKGDPIEKFDFVDGQVYTIPLGVAKHLNSNCWYPQYDYVKADGMIRVDNNFSGNKTMQVQKKKRRVSFQSLEFMDIEELNAPISEVELVKATPIG